MWFSSGCRDVPPAFFLGGLVLLASAGAARAALGSFSYVNEPYYLKGAYHPTWHGSAKLDVNDAFRASARASASVEMYGWFEPRRDPRAWDVAAGLLGGPRFSFRYGTLETAAGVGAILGRAQGGIFYRHTWESGLFPETTKEYRKVLYADVGIPFQAQWLLGGDREGVGFEFSGFLSRELRRWGIGVFRQFSMGRRPPPDPLPAPPRARPVPVTQPASPNGPVPFIPPARAPAPADPGPEREELEE